jgi:hypothetical protein
MGVCVYLTIMPDCIEPDAWQGIYQETLRFLLKHPDEIMGLKKDIIGDLSRTVYSRQLEYNNEKTNCLYWKASGCYRHRNFAESFILQKCIEYYRNNIDTKAKQTQDTDILSITEHDYHPSCSSVFESKTQGYEYHIPILAVAMLIEDAFPQYALVGGNIDRDQAKIAQEMVKDIIGKDIALPVCVESQRLFKRLIKSFPEPEAIRHFSTMFLGDDCEPFKFLLHHYSPQTAVQMFIDRLHNYKSPTQLGAIELFVSWLNAAGDVSTLIDIVCVDKNGPCMSPVELASGLASTWVSIEQSHIQAMNIFTRPKGMPDTVDSQLSMFFLGIHGAKGRNIKRYIPKSDILCSFQSRFPSQFQIIQDTFSKKENSVRENLEQFTQDLTDLQARNKNECCSDSACIDTLSEINTPSQLPPTQDKLIGQLATELNNLVNKLNKVASDVMPGMDCGWEQLQQYIIKFSIQHRIVLTEDAWEWIDAERDMDKLKLLMILMSINSSELTFWNLRQWLLENQAIFSELMKRYKTLATPENKNSSV